MKWILLFLLFLIPFCFACKNDNNVKRELQISDSGIYYFDSLVKFGESKGMLMPEILKRINSFEGNSFAKDIKFNIELNLKNGIYPYDISKFGFGKKINENPLDSYLNSKHDIIYRLIITKPSFVSRTNHIFRIEYHYDTISRTKSYSMIVKTCDTHIPDSLIKVEKINISENHWKTFSSKLEYADFWVLGSDDISGFDGTVWHLSGLKYLYGNSSNRNFRTVIRWTPQKTAFRDAASYLIDLYDKKLTQKYITH